MRFRILGAFFERPAGFLFLTPEEEALIGRRRRTLTAPARIIGSGLDPVAGPATPSHLNALGVTTPFVLYLGRIDPNKGCEALIRHYLGYHARVPRPAPLVLAGPANMPIPQHPAIVPLGVVDADAREALLAAAAVLVVPSPYESLSLVLLEAWNHAVPALVNATCAVLDGQASRSNGALAYRTSDEFAAALEFLLMRRDVAARLGRQGRDYVDREYRWPRVMAQVEDVIRLVVARRTPAPGDPVA